MHGTVVEMTNDFCLSVALLVCGQADSTYLGSSGTRVQCLCEIYIEPALLDLVRAQLDRWGPEHLRGASRAEFAVPSCTRPGPCSDAVAQAGFRSRA